MIFAVPPFVDADILVPATDWFWDQDAPGPWHTFVAVDGDIENLDKWFPDTLPEHAPDRVALRITEEPPVGSCLRWVDEDGKNQERWVKGKERDD